MFAGYLRTRFSLHIPCVLSFPLACHRLLRRVVCLFSDMHEFGPDKRVILYLPSELSLPALAGSLWVVFVEEEEEFLAVEIRRRCRNAKANKRGVCVCVLEQEEA